MALVSIEDTEFVRRNAQAGTGALFALGFLYATGRNWTGLWTPCGKTLAVIAAWWLATVQHTLPPQPQPPT